MKRICPRCQKEMNDNCYVKDIGKASLSYLQLIIQNEDFSKEKKEIKAAYCQKCGYVELFIDPSIVEKRKTIDHQKELFHSVEKYAHEHHQRLKDEQEKLKKEENKQKLLKKYKNTSY
ncbi:MAG: hypothetical protein ACI4SR_10935 [Faecalibacillus sp.]